MRTASNVVDTAARRDRSASHLPAARQVESQKPWDPSSSGSFASKRFDNAPRAMRKRHSFFGRSQSDAGGKATMPTLHSTMSSNQSRPAPPSRPGTALSETRRRKTEPLEHIRNSIFGGRKKSSPPTSRDGSSVPAQRSPSRTDTLAMAESAPRESFNTEQDCKDGQNDYWP